MAWWRHVLVAGVICAAAPAWAEGWVASNCGEEPVAPHYDLGTRASYNDAVAKIGAYQQAAKNYSACVIKQAHAEETAISRAAQNRIAEINVAAVARQQAIYGRLTAQAAAFKAAAQRLKAS